MPNKLLSKSKYLYGLQCPRLLWLATNEPERIPQPDASTQHIFDQGHLVGELAKRLFPGGVDLPTDNFMANIEITRELIQQRKPIFEGGALDGRIYSRVDILNPVNNDEWDIIEVKSATSMKDINIHDVSFQRLCWERCGIKVRKCSLVCINNQYVKNGDIAPEEFFSVNDITAEVAAVSIGLEDRIAEMLNTIDAPACPAMDIGPHCSNPYDCAMQAECWEGLPVHNVFTLYYGGKKSHELYSSGVLNILDIPAGFKLNEKQRIQCDCVACGSPHIDKAAIGEFLGGLEYPLCFLDFETFSTAVPLFDGTRPYQNIPFQYSLHLQERPGGDVKHFEFLAEANGDPRLALLESLCNTMVPDVQIIAYNKSFEERVIRELGGSFPDYAEWAENCISRLIDLIIPFRGFSYYHPSQLGSASLKKVLPAVTGLSYEGMPIGKGDDASLAYLDLMSGILPEKESSKIRDDLLRYCKLDTEGMVRIIGELQTFLA